MPDDTRTSEGGDQQQNLQDMAERATLLYWNSDRSVNSIADDLGLSKGRLYDLIRPIGTGQSCPNCQSELVFTNRTAREEDAPTCPVCDEGLAQVSMSGTPLGSAASVPSALRYADPGDPNEDEEGPPGSAVPAQPSDSGDLSGVLAGFVIGAVAGVLLGRLVRR